MKCGWFDVEISGKLCSHTHTVKINIVTYFRHENTFAEVSTVSSGGSAFFKLFAFLETLLFCVPSFV